LVSMMSFKTGIDQTSNIGSVVSRYDMFQQQQQQQSKSRPKPVGVRRSFLASSTIPLQSTLSSVHDSADDDDEDSTTTTTTTSSVPSLPLTRPIPLAPTISRNTSISTSSETGRARNRETEPVSRGNQLLNNQPQQNTNGRLSMDQVLRREVGQMGKVAGERITEGVILSALEFFSATKKQGQLFVKELTNARHLSPRQKIELTQRNVNTVRTNLETADANVRKAARVWGGIINAIRSSVSSLDEEIVPKDLSKPKGSHTTITLEDDADAADKTKRRKRKRCEKRDQQRARKKKKKIVARLLPQLTQKAQKPATSESESVPDTSSRHGTSWTRPELRNLEAFCVKYPERPVYDPVWNDAIPGRTNNAKYMKARTMGYWTPWTNYELETLHQFCKDNPGLSVDDDPTDLWRSCLPYKSLLAKFDKAVQMGWWHSKHNKD